MHCVPLLYTRYKHPTNPGLLQGRALAILQPYNLIPQALIMRSLFTLASLLFLTLLVSAETSKTAAPPTSNELIAELTKLPTCVVRITTESFEPCLRCVADSHVRPLA